VKPFITEEVDLEDYMQIYGDMRRSGTIASILRFPEEERTGSVVKVSDKCFIAASGGNIGIIGAGNFTSSTVAPCLKRCGAPVKYVASAGGLSAKILARRTGAAFATSDYREILDDSDVKLVIVTTRHNLHARMVKEALGAGKSVFVEKPLCLNEEELSGIIDAYRAAAPGTALAVGFNRRFSPFAEKLKRLSGDGPKNIIATMNAGFIPRDVWVHDPLVGGGRIIGEACHFIDLCSYLTGSRVVSVCMNALGENPDENTDNATILLRYENGSNASVNYFANGSKSYSKERVEVFSQERVFILDNWRSLRGYGVPGFRCMSGRMDKGHRNQFALLYERMRCGGEPLIPFDSIVNTMRASFAAIRSLKEHGWADVL